MSQDLDDRWFAAHMRARRAVARIYLSDFTLQAHVEAHHPWYGEALHDLFAPEDLPRALHQGAFWGADSAWVLIWRYSTEADAHRALGVVRARYEEAEHE